MGGELTMRDGKGVLTYKQLLDENNRLRRENEKLRKELHSRTVAFNKLIKERADHEGVH